MRAFASFASLMIVLHCAMAFAQRDYLYDSGPLSVPQAVPSMEHAAPIVELAAPENAPQAAPATISNEFVIVDPIYEPHPATAVQPTYFDGGMSDSSDSIYQPSPAIDCPPQMQEAIDSEWCLPRVWASTEYVYWWLDGVDVPALVTTSPAGTPQDLAGRLGLSTTSVLFGGDELNDGGRSGARFTLGGWLDLYHMVGVELNFLVLGNDETGFTASDDLPILGRPFFNLVIDEQDAKLATFPGLVEGAVNASIKSEFHTGEALLRKRVRSGITAIDWYLGYRHAGLIDDLRIAETSSVLSGPIVGTEFSASDQFRTRNTFHGVDLAVRFAELLRPGLEVEILGKVALGSTSTETEIVGLSETTLGGTTAMSDFGFLVQPTNAGRFTDDSFSTVSELSIGGRRMFRPGLSLMIGYTFFFWHDVARAGGQVDNAINVTQFPPDQLMGEPRPMRRDVRSNFTAHGFRIGFEYLF